VTRKDSFTEPEFLVAGCRLAFWDGGLSFARVFVQDHNRTG